MGDGVNLFHNVTFTLGSLPFQTSAAYYGIQCPENNLATLKLPNVQFCMLTIIKSEKKPIGLEKKSKIAKKKI